MEEKRTNNGKWAVLAMMLVSLILALLWWKFIPKTNPRQADPGSPYYSPPKNHDANTDLRPASESANHK
jgi:hypothetical protein